MRARSPARTSPSARSRRRFDVRETPRESRRASARRSASEAAGRVGGREEHGVVVRPAPHRLERQPCTFGTPTIDVDELDVERGGRRNPCRPGHGHPAERELEHRTRVMRKTAVPLALVDLGDTSCEDRATSERMRGVQRLARSQPPRGRGATPSPQCPDRSSRRQHRTPGQRSSRAPRRR